MFTKKLSTVTALVVITLLQLGVAPAYARTNSPVSKIESIITMPEPSNLKVNCSGSGITMSAVLSWTNNYSRANGWDIKMSDRTSGKTILNALLPGKTFRIVKISQGHLYSWSVATTDVSGFPQSKAVLGPDFICRAPFSLR